MALKATVCRAELRLDDVDRHHYATYALTLARHPSETDERMMVRVLAFALFADERLAFGRGLSTQDEPDLRQLDLTGAVERWIELGQPDEQRIRRACGRAREVVVVNYGGRAADVWWAKHAVALARLDNLAVLDLPGAAVGALGPLAGRQMELHCLVHDGLVRLSDEHTVVELAPTWRQRPAAQPSSFA
jgi:uncharacterized protein YaeQ